MSRSVRILWMSDSPCLSTGFGRVTREVCRRLARCSNVDLACLGWGQATSIQKSDDLPFRIYASEGHVCGRDSFESVVKEFNPHLVVTLGEIRQIEWVATTASRRSWKWIAYLPIDGGPFYPPWQITLDSVDQCIAMSDFGLEVLRSGLPTHEIKRIYHGIDLSVFRRLEERELIKAHPRFFGRFVIGCVARNQPRKNLPALVEAFAMLAERYPALHLYLHSSVNDPGFDLVQLLRRYRLQGRADLASPEFAIGSGLSDPALNRLYNLFDVTVLPTCAEGFGLPIVESMAAEVPVVATDFSACRELLAGRGELVAAKAIVTLGTNLLQQAFIDVEDLARRMEKLYLSPESRSDYAKAGRAFAETLSWDRLMPQWLEVIGRVGGVELNANQQLAPCTTHGE